MRPPALGVNGHRLIPVAVVFSASTMHVDLSSNLGDVIPAVDALFSRQLPFAAAKALTDTAKLVQAAMPAAEEQDLDRPTQFTKQAFYMQPARKDNLQAVVGVKDAQARYLGYQIEGGERQPRKVLKLPEGVALDQFGNVPRGAVKRLVALARSQRKMGSKTAARLGGKAGSTVFYGVPKGSRARPAGLYLRIERSRGRVLMPLVLFPQRGAHYDPRFKFGDAAVRVVDREFPARLDAAWRQAVATAR